ncbi:MAG: invasion associated locus B family protein [Pseudomonadales bacterium]
MQKRCLPLLLLSLLCLSHGVSAQGGEERQQKVEQTWGDWSRICTTGEPRVCQVVQSANQDETGNLIFQTSIGYVANNDRPIMYLTAPLGIFLPRGISVIVDDDPPLTATVQKCDGNGCLGLLALSQDAIESLKAGTQAQVVFGASAQQNVSIPLSLDGFGAAFDAL